MCVNLSDEPPMYDSNPFSAKNRTKITHLRGEHQVSLVIMPALSASSVFILRVQSDQRTS